MAGVGIAVLGPLTVDDSGALGRRDRIILEALVAHAGRPVSTDQLTDAVWGDRPPASAAKNIQGCVVRLRKLLGQEAILTSSSGYRLDLPADEVDVQRFERSVARSREMLLLGEPDRAAFQLTEALSWWRGEPFDDLAGWAGAETEVQRLHELRLDAEELHVEAHIAAGRHQEVLAQAQTLVGAAPLRERRWALLAHAQYLAGRQGDALRTIHQLKAVLAENLGIDPGPDVVSLETAILRQDASLLGAEAPTQLRATCPYQGLLAYELDDVDRFFGREADVESCLRVLRRSSLLALVGPSGSGKSSLLRAGLAAALRDLGRTTKVITPGRHPRQAWPALAGAPPGTVLLVDQFEEVFTSCEEVEERTEFIRTLVAELDTRTVVIALRSDRLADLAAHPDLGRHVEEGLLLVAGLGEEGLRQAVEAPARQAGLHLEPGLVDLLVREVEGDPGALPLFSHALLETWKRREGNTLTVDGYRATGGIHGAVAQSAERLYAQTDREHRPLLRDLVLRLVSQGPDGEALRTRVPRRLIAADPDHDQMIDALVAARLVTSDEGALEITHEALARAWPRLRAWLDDDVEGQRLLHHLSTSADAWDSMGRPDSELYRGVRLVRALDWQDHTTSALTDAEREFLDRARTVAEIEKQSAAERARAQARLIRRLRIVLSGATVLLVLALAAGGLAAVQSDRANLNAARAEQAAVSADARRVGLRFQFTQDISLSLLLAAAGAQLEDSPETRVNLQAALAGQPLLVRSAPLGGGYLDVFDVSRDGRWIAGSDDQNRMHLYDAATNALVNSYDAGRTDEDGPWVLAAAFSPDSNSLAVLMHGSESTDPVRLLDPRTMQTTTELVVPGDKPVWGVDVRFSADGRYLAATLQTVDWVAEAGSDAPGFALVWDLRFPSLDPRRVPTGPGVQGMALSPDGRILYTANPLTAYDVATGKRLWQRQDLSSWYIALDLNAEGSLLALGDTGDESSRKKVFLVDPVTGRTVHTLRGHRDAMNEVRFSPDGALVGSVASEGELIVWDPATGQPVERWDTTDPYGLGFGPNNDLVHAGGTSSMLRTWDLSMQGTYVRETTKVREADTFAWAHLSPDGEQAAYRWVDTEERGWISFVDTQTGERTPPTRLPAWEGSPWVPGAWHPGGGQYAGYWCELGGCAAPGSVRVLDSATGRPRRSKDVIAGDGDIWAIAYVDRGRGLLLGGGLGPFGNKTIIVDAETLLPSGERFDVPSNCCATPIGDGSTAMVYEASVDLESGHARMLDVHTGEVLAESGVDLIAYTSTASPDGSTVAIAGKTGEILTIDVSTGDREQRSTSLGAPVLWLEYSDDGELLVSGAADGGVSLWDAPTLDLMGTVHPSRRGKEVAAGARFIGDSHDVVIASYDGRVYQWETDLDRALDFACQMAGRDLTEEEWAQFLPAQPYRSVCPQE